MFAPPSKLSVLDKQRRTSQSSSSSDTSKLKVNIVPVIVPIFSPDGRVTSIINTERNGIFVLKAHCHYEKMTL